MIEEAGFFSEAQAISEAVLDAEMRLGELTAAMPKAQGSRKDLTSSSRETKLETKQEALSRVNISKQKASQYELMAAHPDVVEQAIAEARENGGAGYGVDSLIIPSIKSVFSCIS